MALWKDQDVRNVVKVDFRLRWVETWKQLCSPSSTTQIWKGRPEMAPNAWTRVQHQCSLSLSPFLSPSLPPRPFFSESNTSREAVSSLEPCVCCRVFYGLIQIADISLANRSGNNLFTSWFKAFPWGGGEVGRGGGRALVGVESNVSHPPKSSWSFGNPPS